MRRTLVWTLVGGMLVTVTIACQLACQAPAELDRPQMSTARTEPEVERSEPAQYPVSSLQVAKRTYIHCAGSAVPSLSR